MHPIEILQVARGLLATERPECSRVSVGRSYYAAHLFTVRVLHELGWHVPHKGWGHNQAWGLLGIFGTKELTEAGERLKNLYEWRLLADYRLDDEWPESADNAKLACDDALDVINAVHTLSIEPLRGAAVEALAAVAATRLYCFIRGRQYRWGD